MKDWFDTAGMLRLDEIVSTRPSFQRIMQDGRVTPAEYHAQAARVTELLRVLEARLDPEQKAAVTETLGELAVLMALPHVGQK